MTRLPTTRLSTFSSSFVLDNEALRNLTDAFKRFEPNIVLKVELQDEHERVLADPKRISEISNSPLNPVVGVTLQCESDDKSSRATLMLHRNYDAYNCRLSIEGAEDKALKLGKSIDEIFASIRPPWSMLHHMDTPMCLLAIGAVTSIYAFHVIASVPHSLLSAKLFGVLDKWILALTASVTIFLFVTQFAHWIMRRCFSKSIFAINEGQRRHAIHERLRWTSLVGFPLSLFSSLVATIIFLPVSTDPVGDYVESTRVQVSKLPVDELSFQDYALTHASNADGRTSIARFDDKCRGRRVNWCGYVIDVNKHDGLDYYVSMAPYPDMRATCLSGFRIQRTEDAMRLNRLDKVVVDGIVDEYGCLQYASILSVNADGDHTTAPKSPLTFHEYAVDLERFKTQSPNATASHLNEWRNEYEGKQYEWAGVVENVSSPTRLFMRPDHPGRDDCDCLIECTLHHEADVENAVCRRDRVVVSGILDANGDLIACRIVKKASSGTSDLPGSIEGSVSSQ